MGVEIFQNSAIESNLPLHSQYQAISQGHNTVCPEPSYLLRSIFDNLN